MLSFTLPQHEKPAPTELLQGTGKAARSEITPDPKGRPEETVAADGGLPRELDPLVMALSVSPHHVAAAQDAGVAAGSFRGPPSPAAVEVAVVEQVVRRVLWGGDRRRGVARIELDGELAGTTLWVRGEGRDLSLEVVLGPSRESRELPERLVERLRARGIDFTAVEVR